MYGLYYEEFDTLISLERYWCTRELAEAATQGVRARSLQVLPVPLTVDDYEVAGGRIERARWRGESHRHVILSALDRDTGHRQAVGWYASTMVALKKRRKMRDDPRYGEWRIEWDTMDDIMYSECVDHDTESG